MLVETFLGGMVLTGISYLMQDLNKNKRYENKIEEIFEDVISYEVPWSELHFEISETIFKKYGFDLKINVKKENIFELKKHKKALENKFGGEILIENGNENNIILKCVLYENKMTLFEKLIWEWNKIFDSIRDQNGDTFKIHNINEIKNYNNEIVGHDIKCIIPSGLSIKDFSENVQKIEKLGMTFSKWNKKEKVIEVQIITKNLSIENFKKYKCEPYQLFLGLKYNYDPVLFDYKIMANGLITGIPTSGKTMTLIHAFFNLAIQYSHKDVLFYIGSASDKKDTRIFSDLPHTKKFSRTLEETDKLLDELITIQQKRNLLFEKEKYIVNIFEYNSSRIHFNERLPIIHFFTDEFTEFVPVEGEPEEVFMLKKRIETKIHKLGREGRSVGIFLTLATQRTDYTSISPVLKSLLPNKVIFKLGNQKTAELIVGEDKLKTQLILNLDIKEREFLFENYDGYNIGKSTFLSKDLLIKETDKIIDDYNKSMKSKKEKFKLIKKGKKLKEKEKEINPLKEKEVAITK